MNFTVDQFVQANGTEKPVAYGFLRYLAETGFATTTKTDKVPGKRGKPSTIYTLTPAALNVFTNIKPYVAPVATVEVTAETTQVSEQPAAV